MIQGLWQSAAGLQGQQLRQAVLANNVANADTPGFKPDFLALIERPIAAVAGDALGATPWPRHPTLDAQTGGLTWSPTFTDFAAGPIVTDGGPLDVAIEGDGFLAVRTPEGERFTRNGRLALRSDGALVTAAGGYEVVNAAGDVIRVNRASSQPVVIDARGAVRQGETALGALRLADFADRAALRKVGANLFDASAAAPINASATVRQYAYEGSGVDAVGNMVRMIEAARAYEMNATMISIQDQTLGRVVNDVGRVA